MTVPIWHVSTVPVVTIGCDESPFAVANASRWCTVDRSRSHTFSSPGPGGPQRTNCNRSGYIEIIQSFWHVIGSDMSMSKLFVPSSVCLMAVRKIIEQQFAIKSFKTQLGLHTEHLDMSTISPMLCFCVHFRCPYAHICVSATIGGSYALNCVRACAQNCFAF